MEEDVRPPSQEYLAWPTLLAIRESGGAATNEEISRSVAHRLNLSDDQRTRLKAPQGGRSLYEYRLAWARTALKQMGAIVNDSLKHWSLTDLGRTLSEEDIRDFSKAKLRRLNDYNMRRGGQSRRQRSASDSTTRPD